MDAKKPKLWKFSGPTLMKMKEDDGQTGIFQVFDLENFFDKESHLDCMYTLNKKTKIDNKSYR